MKGHYVFIILIIYF